MCKTLNAVVIISFGMVASQCPRVCPLNFAPICAALRRNPRQLRTFPNYCALNIENCRTRGRELIQIKFLRFFGLINTVLCLL